MLCIQTGKTMSDAEPDAVRTEEFYRQVARRNDGVFNGVEDVLARTLDIAQRCQVKLEKVRNRFRSSTCPTATPSTATSNTWPVKDSRSGWRTIRGRSQGRLKHRVAEYENGWSAKSPSSSR